MNTTVPKTSKKLTKLAITLGDPAGIGAEIILKALSDPAIEAKCSITVVGTRSLLHKTYQHLSSFLPANSLIDPDKLSILDIAIEPNLEAEIAVGQGNVASGEASFRYLKEAIDRTLAGEFQGIVTAPIAKSLWQKAGHDYPGQTEVLAMAAGVEKYGMLFVARSPYTNWTLRTILATTHIPLSQVCSTLNSQLMSLKLDLLIQSLKNDFGIDCPTIVVSGLNPHSGEEGKLGREEQDWILDWLEQERKNYPKINLIGLVPPDTLWIEPSQAWYGNLIANHVNSFPANPADGYIALYHDQGLIPVKLMAFEQAINTTIGLPFIRTSPDHGTAFNIAGKGIAKSNSMKAAIELAAELVTQRNINFDR